MNRQLSDIPECELIARPGQLRDTEHVRGGVFHEGDGGEGEWRGELARADEGEVHVLRISSN